MTLGAQLSRKLRIHIPEQDHSNFQLCEKSVLALSVPAMGWPPVIRSPGSTALSTIIFLLGETHANASYFA